MGEGKRASLDSEEKASARGEFDSVRSFDAVVE
jgi:hypothetical protein